MDTLVLILVLILGLWATAGWIWLVFLGFRVGVAWGFLNLLLQPFAGIAFAWRHWEQARNAFLNMVVPSVISTAVAGVFVLGAEVELREAETIPERPPALPAQDTAEPEVVARPGIYTSTAPAAATRDAASSGSGLRAPPRFRFREVRADELIAVVGESVRVDLVTGRERNGVLVSVVDGQLQVEQRRGDVVTTFEVPLTEARRVLVREVVE